MAGQFKRRVTIKQATAGSDENGQPIDTWTQVGQPRWADIRNPTGLQAGQQVARGDALVTQVRTSIRLRWCTDIVAGMRAHYGSTVYDIKAALPDESGRQYVDLVCEVMQ